MNQLERNEDQRKRRKENGNAYTLKYERTKKGKIMRIYRNMLSRVTGVQAAKYHLYKGKSLVGKDFFYKWTMGCQEFHALFDCWVNSGFDRKLAPSVDRVDSSQGYSVGNMEWVTHSENSRRGAISQRMNGLCKLAVAA
jgi:hypothetical protein